MTGRILLVTDIGTDVDDAIALVYALRNPDIDLAGIATTHGKTKVRAAIASRYLQREGRDIPIAPGSEALLTPGAPTHWCGFEGAGIIDGSERIGMRTAAELIASTLLEHPGTVSLVCIGPLTDVALTLELDARIAAAAKHVYIMGDTMESHNLKTDPAATERVLGATWPVTLIPTELSRRAAFKPEQLAGLDPLIERNARDWLAYAKKKLIHLYDPLTVEAALDTGLLGYAQETTTRRKAVTADVNRFKQRVLAALRSRPC
jgi:purine nucleosidase